jgi:hypothetical protein
MLDSEENLYKTVTCERNYSEALWECNESGMWRYFARECNERLYKNTYEEEESYGGVKIGQQFTKERGGFEQYSKPTFLLHKFLLLFTRIISITISIIISEKHICS